MSFALTVITAIGLAGSTFAADTTAGKTKVQAKSAKKTTSTKSEKAEKGSPTLTIVEPLKDYGTVPRGEKLEAEFVIKNTGTSDLQLLSVQPGCGCTVADFDKVIKPGKSGKVRAHVDTTNFSGPISKSVTVQTNDPNTPTSQLTIHALVKPFVEAFPGGFVRFNTIQGDAQTQTIKLYTEEDAPFEIVSKFPMQSRNS